MYNYINLYKLKLNNVYYRNNGGEEINWQTNELRNAGTPREDLSYNDYNELLNSKVFLKNGALLNSDMIHRGIIDVFVPFLPLEKEHVKLCIIKYLQDHRNFTSPLKKPGSEFITKVADQILFISNAEVYSRFGCKRVPITVDIELESYNEDL